MDRVCLSFAFPDQVCVPECAVLQDPLSGCIVHIGQSEALCISGGPLKVIGERPVEVSDDHIEIGMSFDSFVIERWQRERDVFIATAKELGAEVNVQTANGEVVSFSAEKQRTSGIS